MNVVHDTRPSAELSDTEVVAYLFQAIRARSLRTAAQVQQECQRLFPDLPEERQRQCYGQLAQALEKTAV